MSTIEQLIHQAAARNADLLRILAETDHAPPALKEHAGFISDLESQIKSNESKLKELECKRVAELADHEKYRDSHFRRFAFKATGQKEKFTARAAKEEQEYFDVLQQQHQMTVVNSSLKQQLEQARKAQADLQAAALLHQDSQRELDSLYNSIFAGETPAFPEEDALERKSDAALQRYHDVRVNHEEKTRIISLLQAGLKKVDEAVSSMDEARGASRLDMFGGGMLADAMERSSLTRAEVAYQEARSLAERAHYHNLPVVNINHGHIFRDVFFDNIFTDMQFHEEIKRAELEVKKFGQAMERRMISSQDRLSAVARELKECEQNLETSRIELQVERQKLFERFARDKTTAVATN